MHPSGVESVPRLRWIAATAIALALVATGVHLSSIHCDFVNYDDDLYVYANPIMSHGFTWQGLTWAFTTAHTGYWHPLTWVSLMLDRTMFGPGPRGFHFTNVLLHALNSALVFLTLRTLTGATKRCAVVALLWAVHPLRVESVAWVSERKDVLSAMFGMLATWAYAKSVRVNGYNRALQVIAFFSLGLSLLAKPMMVTLPALWMVLDWWPLNRWQQSVSTETSPQKLTRRILKLFVEKWPAWLMAIAVSVATLATQHGQGITTTTTQQPILARLANAVIGYASYLGKIVWPMDLIVLYPLPRRIQPVPLTIALITLAFVTAWAIWRRRQQPWLLAGWLWFLGLLFPVIGVIQVGVQAMADRYTYWATLGPMIAVVWVIAENIGDGTKRRVWSGVIVIVAAVALSFLTIRQISVWRSSRTLWEHALRVDPMGHIAWNNLGTIDASEGRLDEAGAKFQQAVNIESYFAGAWINLGRWHELRQRLDEALSCFRMAVRARPTLAEGHKRMGIVLLRLRRDSEAAAAFGSALVIDPTDTDCWLKRGLALVRVGMVDEGIDCLKQAVRLAPTSAPSHYALALSLASVGRDGDALPYIQEAIRLDPTNATYSKLLESMNDKSKPATAP